MGDENSGSARRGRRLFQIRPVRASDIPAIVSLDGQVTKIPKPGYWADLFRRCGKSGHEQRTVFLVAECVGRPENPVAGFIAGEVRAWEFGSAPCGWVFALSVESTRRLCGVGEALFEAVVSEFRKTGVRKIRTMVARDARLPALFFRSQGMRAGPYVQLERDVG
jgi:hypothetical protein